MIEATNTCPVDTVLQMLYCMWTQNIVPHQIIEDCEPIHSKSLSLIKEGNHAYARVHVTNDAIERKEKILHKFIKKEIVENKDG